MSLQSAGKSWDNRLAQSIDEYTPDLVNCHATRGSGNTNLPNLDVLVRTPIGGYAIEGKRRSWDTDERGAVLAPDDVKEMYRCLDLLTSVGFALRFTKRELIFVGPIADVKSVDDLGQRIADDLPACIEATYTDSGYVRARKPDTSEWTSSTAGHDDGRIVAEAIGYGNYASEVDAE